MPDRRWQGPVSSWSPCRPSSSKRCSTRSGTTSQRGRSSSQRPRGSSQSARAESPRCSADLRPGHPVAVLSGPSFAREVALGRPTALVVASLVDDVAVTLQKALTAPTFRIYTNRDVAGVEIAGAVKNVMAIATGLCDGLELGENARAALITRGLAEIVRLGMALGAQPTTFLGLAGLGDLVLTCTGSLSRNRALGFEIARGRSLEQVEESTRMVAEGVRTVAPALALARDSGISMPICRGSGRRVV